MAYFAQLNESNVVIQVISVSDDHCQDPAPNNEQDGIQYIVGLGLGSNWIQTSFNNKFRKQFAGIGFFYDLDADVFIAPKPYPSWSLDADHDWQAPTPKPEGRWIWNEDELNWIEFPIPSNNEI